MKNVFSLLKNDYEYRQDEFLELIENRKNIK